MFVKHSDVFLGQTLSNKLRLHRQLLRFVIIFQCLLLMVLQRFIVAANAIDACEWQTKLTGRGGGAQISGGIRVGVEQTNHRTFCAIDTDIIEAIQSNQMETNSVALFIDTEFRLSGPASVELFHVIANGKPILLKFLEKGRTGGCMESG